MQRLLLQAVSSLLQFRWKGWVGASVQEPAEAGWAACCVEGWEYILHVHTLTTSVQMYWSSTQGLEADEIWDWGTCSAMNYEEVLWPGSFGQLTRAFQLEKLELRTRQDCSCKL